MDRLQKKSSGNAHRKKLEGGLGYKEKPEENQKVNNKTRPKITPNKFVTSKETRIDFTSIEEPTSKNETITNNKSRTVEKKENKRKNMGLLFKGQLNRKISETTGKPLKKNIKRHKNGKEGINKRNNYEYVLQHKHALTVVTLIIWLLTARRVRRNQKLLVSLILQKNQ